MNELRDPLTGLHNRAYLLQILDGVLGHNGQIVLMFVDIDRFATFNCSLGHKEGDNQLIELGREIQALVGKSSLVCRWSGDAFGIVVYENSLGNARDIAERIRAYQASAKLKLDHGTFSTFTLSIGLAHFPDQSHDATSLIEAAEIALWKAKKGGRWLDGSPYSGRNRVIAMGDFLDEPDDSIQS